jgi:hypothetical protein
MFPCNVSQLLCKQKSPPRFANSGATELIFRSRPDVFVDAGTATLFLTEGGFAIDHIETNPRISTEGNAKARLGVNLGGLLIRVC